MTTTWPLIAQQMSTTLRGTAPAVLKNVGYTVSRSELPSFAGWVEAGMARPREFAIEGDVDDMAAVTNNSIELRRATATLTVAYPHEWGMYRTKRDNRTWNRAALEALALSDRNVIDKAIGRRGSGAYLAAQRSAEVMGSTLLRREYATLLVLHLETHYYHDAS